jgi:hypothetical protein
MSKKTIPWNNYVGVVFWKGKPFKSVGDLLWDTDLFTKKAQEELKEHPVYGGSKSLVRIKAEDVLNQVLEVFSDPDNPDQNPVDVLTPEAMNSFKTFWRDWQQKYMPNLYGENRSIVIDFKGKK